MNLHNKFKYLVLTSILYSQIGGSQEFKFEDIPLDNLGAFANAGKNWIITSEFFHNYSKPWNLKKLATGTGVVINDLTERSNSHLVTKKEFGDIEVELEFMMDKGSNSGIYLQGRYEVQLFDSWLAPDPTFSDCGGIYQYWDESRTIKGYGGMAPLSNASRAPGLWQHLRIRFKAPRFDTDGNKIANARFDEVYLNGVLVQQQVEVTGPTRASLFDNEKPTGPLVFQGDHGKVAFRNIRYRPSDQMMDSKRNRVIGAIVVRPDDKPYLLRSFMMFGDRKLDYVVSMGSPLGLNYSYNLRKGAWLQVWRGGFMEATDMWYSRGVPQLATPLGSVVPFTDAPTVAQLSDTDMVWPDSLEFDDLQNDGYLLDKKGVPTFKYTIKGIELSDKISPINDGSGLNRTLKIENPSGNLYCRVISANEIEQVDKGLYRVDGAYYIRMDKNSEPFIRVDGQRKEMLISLDGPGSPLIYSVIW